MGRPAPNSPWPSNLGDDAVNTWIRDRDANRSTDELLAAYDTSSERLAALVRALPAEDFDDAALSRWLEIPPGATPGVDDFFAHLHHEHEPAVRSWLAGR